MLFPVLKNLQADYSEYIINNFDEWLGTRRLATIKTLSPLHFATDTGIDDTIAINLFFDCCEPDIALLRASWHVECPCCDSILQRTTSYTLIEDGEKYCEDCGSSFTISDECIFVWFARLIEPDAELLASMHKRDYLGNSSGGKTITAAMVKQKTPWDDLIQRS